MHFIQKNGFFLAWIMSIIGTIAAFYMGEVSGYAVCHLCWYQRICLFPLVMLLGMGVYKDDKSIACYVIPLTVIGALLALYQYGLQMIPGFEIIDVCGVGAQCSEIHFKWFGFITLPLLSFVNFSVLSFFLIV